MLLVYSKVSIIFILALWHVIPHPIHIAICDIKLNAKTSALEISHKIFLDDLEAAIKKEFGVDLKTGSSNELKESNEYIQKYIQRHFSVYLNKKEKLKTSFIGKETETDALWIYMEVKNVKKLSSLKIENTILMELYDDQANIVNVKKGDSKKSASFRKEEQVKEISF